LKGLTGLYFEPINDNQILADHKARLYLNRSLRRGEFKVGAVGSRNPVGQAAQAVGTIITPGNISPARSPIRSGIARALTPGGGRNRGGLPGKPERGYRCPEGFQFGGRFTDEDFTTCGKQLFDIPSLKESVAQAVFRTRSRRSAGSDGGPRAEADVEVVAPGETDRDNELMVRRAARVPEVGSGSNSKKTAAEKDSIVNIVNQPENSSVLVRRDGFIMVPVVSTAELRKVPDNRNMEEATWIQSVRSPEEMGKDELGLLSNTGVTKLVYVTPNGVTVTLERTRDLDTGERRQLGKDVNTAADMDVNKDPLARLNFIVENSEGAFKLSTDFGDVKNPEQIQAGGKNKGMPKWAVEAFVDAPEPRTEDAADLDEPAGDADAPEAPDAPETPASVAPAPLEERIDSVKEAVEHLNKGGLLADIDPSVLYEALQRAEEYKKRKIRDDITVLEGPNGLKLLLKENNEDFEHISAHYSSELLRELGVQAPAVRFAGSETNRPFVYRSPDDVIENAELDRDIRTEDFPPERILGIQISDWLADTRGRTAASVVGVRVGDETEPVANIGPRSALIGLDADELAARRDVGLEQFFDDTTAAYGRTFGEAEQQEKDLMLQILESLIERANEFSWEDYRAKLAADGIISEAEERHLSIVQELFNRRLEALNSSKETIQTILGLV
jgi:hypothetical protein